MNIFSTWTYTQVRENELLEYSLRLTDHVRRTCPLVCALFAMKKIAWYACV